MRLLWSPPPLKCYLNPPSVWRAVCRSGAGLSRGGEEQGLGQGWWLEAQSQWTGAAVTRDQTGGQHTHTHTQADTPHLYALSIFTSRYLRSLAAFGGPQTVTRCLSLGGDGAGPAAGGAAGRAGAGGGREWNHLSAAAQTQPAGQGHPEGEGEGGQPGNTQLCHVSLLKSYCTWMLEMFLWMIILKTHSFLNVHSCLGTQYLQIFNWPALPVYELFVPKKHKAQTLLSVNFIWMWPALKCRFKHAHTFWFFLPHVCNRAL